MRNWSLLQKRDTRYRQQNIYQGIASPALITRQTQNQEHGDEDMEALMSSTGTKFNLDLVKDGAHRVSKEWSKN